MEYDDDEEEEEEEEKLGIIYWKSFASFSCIIIYKYASSIYNNITT